jgi:hypothetical protein
MIDRRHFLSTAATGVAASLAYRSSLFAQLENTPPLPDRSLLDKNEDASGPKCAANSSFPPMRSTSTMAPLDRVPHLSCAPSSMATTPPKKWTSRTSPDPALRCGIVSVNCPPVPRMDLENWLWKTHKIRIRGGDPNKLRFSPPYYLQKKDIDRFLEKFDEYKREKKVA